MRVVNSEQEWVDVRIDLLLSAIMLSTLSVTFERDSVCSSRSPISSSAAAISSSAAVTSASVARIVSFNDWISYATAPICSIVSLICATILTSVVGM